MKILKTLAIGLGVLLMASCNKGESSLKVWMTDAPGDYQEVNIDIQQVRVNIKANDNDRSGWYDLPTNAGVYDLLDYQNLNAFEIAYEPSLPSGTISEIRFVLGDENTVLVDDVYHDLDVPSGQSSGLKLKKVKLRNDQDSEVLIDFDAEASLSLTGSGQYKLSPVLKIID